MTTREIRALRREIWMWRALYVCAAMAALLTFCAT